MTEQTQAEKRRRDGRSKFMALRETVAREVEGGHTARSIYDRHFDQSGLSYSQFARYVAKYVRPNDRTDSPGATIAGEQETPRPVAPQPVNQSEPPARTDRPATGIGARFQHHAQPDDDDKII